jgi:hypothetical protein
MKTGNTSLGPQAVLATVVLSFAWGVALADPPGRVARLAYVNGAVSFAPAGSDDWVQAGVNRPLMPGDRLWVDPGGRDEVQIGSAALRMDGGTLVSVLSMNDRSAQLQLTQGRAYLRVRRLDPGEVMEVDTPNLALAIRKPGVYRLEVDPNGNTTAVAVRSGQAEAYGDGSAYLIDPGQAYRFGGTNLQDYQFAQMPPDNDFERWASQRDLRRDRALARRYVSPEVPGYEDLDDNGSWREVPNYGSVWMPAHVASDWAPYRDGHWSWIDPWGWTWVDDAPWGFTVSHYGRWTHLDAGWGWVPGPPVERPVYAPALVAFVAGAALALELDRRPAVAWFPLGPHEVYRPAYQASPRYITNVNVSNTVINRTQINQVVNVNNVTNVNYVNRQVPGAVTAVPTQAFVRAQPVRQAAVPLSRQMLAQAPVTSKLALAPQAASRTGERPAGKAPASMALARQVIAHTPPQLPATQKAAPPRGLPRPGTAALAAASPQVRVAQAPRGGRLLAPPPPPAHALAAAAPQQGARPINGLPQAGRAPDVAHQPQVALPPEAAHSPQAARSPEMAHQPQVARPPEMAHQAQVARPPEMAHQPQAARPPEAGHPPQVAAQQPRSQLPPHAEALPHALSSPNLAPRLPAQQARAEALHPPGAAAHPPESAHPSALPPRDLPHQLAQAKPAEPPRPQPPRDLPHQMAQAKPAESHPQPAPAEAHRPPPSQSAAPEHHASPEKDKRKEEH